MTVLAKEKYMARFFGPFRIVTNTKMEEFKLDHKKKITIKDLIGKIIEKYDELKDSFYINGELNNNVNIVINGEDIRSGNGLDTEIHRDDRITFFKGVGGG